MPLPSRILLANSYLPFKTHLKEPLPAVAPPTLQLEDAAPPFL